MNQENNFDEIDKIFVDYFKNEKIEPIPKSVQDSFNETLNKIKSSYNYIYYLSKVAVIVVIIGILSTSVVFAKDIVHFISSIFTNSTEAINTAIDNNYVQELNLDYVYYNDVGVTIDYILLDNSNLDISLIYKYIGSDTIDEIIIDEFKIKSDKEAILWERAEEENTLMEGATLSKISDVINIDKNVYKDSLLISSKHFSEINSIILEINSFKIKINGEYKIQDGKWIIEAKIDKDKLKREKVEYEIESNEYISDSFIEMTETSLNIHLDFNIMIDTDILKNPDNVVLIDAGYNKHSYKKLDLYNEQTLYLEYDIGRFSENIENFTLEIMITDDEMIVLKAK